MNSSAVRSSARVFRLVDLDSVRDDVEPTPVENEAPPTVEGVRLAPLRWPEPIGSGPAAANADQVKPGQAKPQVQLRVKVHAPLPRMPKGQMATLPVSFSGRPTEYARLWFRNVILVLLTFGLYAPWARVHAQRYFLRRTQLAGECLDYHADPAALLPRYVLTGGLVAGVIGAWAGSRLAGMMALSLALAVVPLLVYMTLTHRVAHISWAGRRLQFDGRCQGVYQAMWAPLTGACLVAWLLMATLAWNRPGGWFAWGMVAAVWGMAVPTFVWVYFQYRQHHLVLGPVRLLWQGHRMAVATLFVKTLAWFAMVCMLTAGLGAIVLAAVLAVWRQVSTLTLACGLAVLAGVVLAAVLPYAQARLQNLVWSKTDNRYLRFRSRLPVQAYVGLQMRNAVLLVLTLGLYWPWAVVASRRMRTESLLVCARVETDVLKANWTPRKRAKRTKMAG